MKLQAKTFTITVDSLGRLTLSGPGGLTFAQKGTGNLTYRGGKETGEKLCLCFTLGETPVDVLCAPADDGVELAITSPENTPMPADLDYPGTWELLGSDIQIMALGEGLAFRADDPAELPIPRRLRLGSSGDSSMSLWGVLRGDGWFYQSALTNSDCELVVDRGCDGLWHQSPRWIAEKGVFGYPRILRIALGLGGLTGLAASYRELVTRRGFVRTIAEKTRAVPNSDRFRGASNVWLWNDDAMHKLYDADAEYRVPDAEQIARRMSIADDMKENGMDRVLWSIFDENLNKEAIDHVKSLGFLTTTYDVYTDVIPRTVAEKIPDTRRVRCAHRVDWWPKGIAMDKDGNYVGAWRLKGKDGIFYDQNQLCDVEAYHCAKDFIPHRAKTYGLEGWFFDVQTIHLYECYHPDHPMTRRESVGYKKRLLGLAEELGLFGGTENGREEYAPDFLYSEGMMSPVCFRTPDAGRRMTTLYYGEEVEPNMTDYMLNPAYRIPLWEMIYHDVAVSYWYWGDSSNCAPELMDRRNLINLLYGLPGLYSFRAADWELLRDKILASHRLLSDVAAKSSHYRMTEFAWLTDDHMVQRTTFGPELSITVNFGEEDYVENDRVLPAGGWWIKRKHPEAEKSVC